MLLIYCCQPFNPTVAVFLLEAREWETDMGVNLSQLLAALPPTLPFPFPSLTTLSFALSFSHSSLVAHSFPYFSLHETSYREHRNRPPVRSGAKNANDSGTFCVHQRMNHRRHLKCPNSASCICLILSKTVISEIFS